MSKTLIAMVTLFICAAFLATGCIPLGMNNTFVKSGGIYTNVSIPNSAMDANARVVKSGKGECKSVLGIVAWGDCSVQAAMKNGRLKKVHHVDNKVMSILFFYSKTTTVAYGE
jgi:hypothetical protein